MKKPMPKGIVKTGERTYTFTDYAGDKVTWDCMHDGLLINTWGAWVDIPYSILAWTMEDAGLVSEDNEPLINPKECKCFGCSEESR